MGGAVGGLGGGWRNSVYTCTVLQPLHVKDERILTHAVAATIQMSNQYTCTDNIYRYTSILLAALMTYRKPVRQTAENLQKYLRNKMLTKLLHTWKWSHNKTHFKMLLMPLVSVKTFRALLVNVVCAKLFWAVEHFYSCLYLILGSTSWSIYM